ncbi:N-acetylneuraminate synthase family protein [Pseudorhodoplanes sp.]|jgi:N,N'-diacetyllegionaminate synthase|uniref:N-acetylneuraminate synthase family protein n=1 Tax=Pseudorhodoplanes sp. TaxID=1934341 RepID=UPI002C7B01F8|nr:N-acetylneuraminate synthase family protein [Pseudorhodoplanes sp.]HWV41408.1 N-acetylneuraminate synthase family protein [Pseudorhodoplanes sp.]
MSITAFQSGSASRGSASFAIDGRPVGGGQPPYLIAEVAQAHDGSLGFAHAFIDAAAAAGADAIKFQTHFADEESTRDEPFRVKFSKQDATRFDYWKRMEFTDEQWAGLADHAREKKLAFISSAFSARAVELLERLGMPAWKVASGEVLSPGFLQRIAATGKPVLLSTGMSPYAEIAKAFDILAGTGAAVAILQCTSRYPTALQDVGLNVIDELRRRFGCVVGLSDHSGQIYPAMIAMARGADLIEAHITLDKRMFGPDVSSSLTVEEFAMLSAMRDSIAVIDSHPVDKDAMAEAMKGMRELFQKSVALTRPLPAGTVLTRDMLTTKKPATGIPAAEIERVVGRRLARDAVSDRVLNWSDLDE